jgi:lipoprotein-anchoring transpeptidase ErfK/SrfK
VKYFVIATVMLFGVIGVVGWFKKEPKFVKEQKAEPVQEISLGTSSQPIPIQIAPVAAAEVPEIDRVQQLFALDSSELPIVQTVSFTSRVPWLKDRPAWIADYASHFQTSRHFIARSLNRTTDYLTQKVHPGDRFNVFKEGKDIKFHLTVDLSKSRMWFYYLDGNEKVLLKTYRVGLGKKDSRKTSGFLTPVGKFGLGEKIAIYKPGVIGFFQDEKVEMIRVFGTRWLPFEKEIEGCSEPAKGFGIHGVPWIQGPDGQLLEDKSKIGSYDSDGCIRMASEDVEEIFAIVITKPTTVEIVKEYKP